jgi:two-component sensor histidine kinase
LTFLANLTDLPSRRFAKDTTSRFLAIFAYMKNRILLLLLVVSSSLHGQKADPILFKIDSLLRFHRYTDAQLFLEKHYSQSGGLRQLELAFRKATLLEQKERNRDAVEVLHDLERKTLNKGHFELLCRVYIKLALVYEKFGEYQMAANYLEKAEKFVDKYTHLHAKVLVRKSILLSQRSDSLNQALETAYEALMLAERFRDSTAIQDSKLILGSINRKLKKHELSNSYYTGLLPELKHYKNGVAVQLVYHNIARNYLEMGQFLPAKIYNDSAYQNTLHLGDYYRSLIFKQRAALYYQLRNLDSTYAFQNAMHDAYVAHMTNAEINKVKDLEQNFAHQKNAVIIRNQKVLLFVALLSLLLVTFLSIKLFRRNRKISAQNLLIAGQRDDLQILVEQKSVLLKELQHRVKNNLQHVISILEIQKEAVNFSNMEELVRENQNRIHSMSLLYSRLNSSEDIQFVRLEEYFVSISHLVKESYGSMAKKVKLDLSCQMDKMEIAKVLPLGMILVELISNSIKHAFEGKAEGKIFLHVWKEDRNYVFHYMDNGRGYNFNDVKEGALGMEIIRGLIQQLQGTVVNRNNTGFELRIVFQ